MEAGSAVYSPQEKLLEAAALITFAAEHLHSYTGLLAFDGKVVRMFQLRRGREPSLHILNALERIAVSGSKNNGTALTFALEAAAKSLRQRTLVIILSDFKVENFEKNWDYWHAAMMLRQSVLPLLMTKRCPHREYCALPTPKRDLSGCCRLIRIGSGKTVSAVQPKIRSNGKIPASAAAPIRLCCHTTAIR